MLLSSFKNFLSLFLLLQYLDIVDCKKKKSYLTLLLFSFCKKKKKKKSYLTILLFSFLCLLRVMSGTMIEEHIVIQVKGLRIPSQRALIWYCKDFNEKI